MNRKYMVTIIVILLMVPTCLFAECFNYEPETTILTGKIIRKTFPGPPNYESIKDGDEPETYWILISANPFCVNAEKGDPSYSFESGIKDVQLIFKGDEYRKNKNLVGKDVIATGQLMPMQTGHHNTMVLLIVKEIHKKR
jgi:hypothetical protein